MAQAQTEKMIAIGKRGKYKKLDKLLTSKKADVRAAAAIGMGYVDTDEACTRLITALRDPDETVVLAVISALGNMRFASRSIEHLRRVIGTRGADVDKACADAVRMIESH